MKATILVERDHRPSRLVGNPGVLLLFLFAVGLSGCDTEPRDGDDIADSRGNRCPAGPDTDGDGTADACDNCPASPNSGQADTDGDGLGDTCSGVRAEGFAFSSPDGNLEVLVDERLRPTLSVGPGQAIALLWSDDASRVNISLSNDGTLVLPPLPVDFSDQALLEAIDAEEAEIGDDVTELRDFIRDQPGFVESLARGDAEAPDVARRTRPRSAQQKIQVAYQQIQGTSIFEHMQRLSAAELLALGVVGLIIAQIEDGQIPDILYDHYIALADSFKALARQLRETRRMLVPECILACTDRCPVECFPASLPEPERGACCYLDLEGSSICENNLTLAECLNVDGVLRVGRDCETGLLDVCTAACCITTATPGIGSRSCCVNLLPEVCVSIESDRDPNSIVNTTHDRTRRCGDSALDCPVCPP